MSGPANSPAGGAASAPAVLSLDAVEDLALRALAASRTSAANAAVVARSIRAAEADGIRSHGLMRLPTYCEHARSGKVDGAAVPTIARTAVASLMADARCGFAHPAIEAGFAALVPLARDAGIAGLGVANSYNCGVVGHHVEALAESGLLALAFVNAPASIAPWGGSKPLFGTNPVALAAPRRGVPPLVIDQSSSVIARGEIMLHAQDGKAIPPGWALDPAGRPTTDAAVALKGSLLPAGGHKGAGLALMVELLAAALVGTNLSMQASSFADNAGGPPRTGQLFLALDPERFAGRSGFLDRAEAVLAAMLAQPGVRLPGQKRLAARARIAKDGVSVPRALLARIEDMAAA